MRGNIKTSGIEINIFSLLLILTHSIYVYLDNRLVVNVIYVVLSFFPVYLILKRKKRFLVERRALLLLAALFLFCSLLLIQVVNSGDYISFICRYLIFLPATTIFFVDLIQHNREMLLYKTMRDQMYFLAFVSLFFWLFATILRIIPPSGEVWSNWGRAYRSFYYGLYMEVPSKLLSTPIYRNVSIFCEAPAFAFFLSLAYAYEKFFSTTKNQIRQLVLILAMLSTGTSTALIVLVYCFIAERWLNRNKNSANRRLEKLVGGALIVAAVFFLQRFIFSDSKRYSVYLRQMDYLNGIKAWLLSPIWGHGYMTDVTTYKSGFSNSISQLLIGGGLVLFLIYLLAFWIGIRYGLHKHLSFLFWFICLILLFSVSVVGYTYICLSIVAFGYAMLWKNKKGYYGSY